MITSVLTVTGACLALAGMEPSGEFASELLIVGPQAFREALRPFVEHKKARLATEVVTLEAVLKETAGVDDAEKLKRYLYDAWKTRRVRYVLLVGDADVMPVRYMVLDRVTKEAFDYAFYPSDLYFADVARADGSFDDWNGNKEGFHAGYFGEVRGEKNKDGPMNYDSVSYMPELAVGRWPVSTLEQVKAVAAKTIAYDEAMERGEIRALAACIVPGGWVDARGTMDAAAGKLGAGWKVEKRYYLDAGATEATKGTGPPAGGPSPPKALPPDEAQVVGLLNDGASLVVHAGHGSDDSWAGCFSVRSIATLKVQAHPPHPAVMISAGCSTARFCTLPPYEPYMDAAGVEHRGTNAGEVFTAPPPPPACYARGKYNMTGLGETLVRDASGGAVCYIGCNTGSQPCGLTLETAFVEEVGSGKWEARGEGNAKAHGPRVGDCWAAAVADYYEREHLATLRPDPGWYPASIFFQGMKFMLYGDPTVELPGSRRSEER